VVTGRADKGKNRLRILDCGLRILKKRIHGLEQAAYVLSAAFGVQYIGLLAERWFFFAQSNHPQNLYYQTVS